MQSLQARKSSRDFSTKKLPVEVLSNLLWAAYGINRPESGRRTAPSAVNWQKLISMLPWPTASIFTMPKSAFATGYQSGYPGANGKQTFVKDAPVI